MFSFIPSWAVGVIAIMAGIGLVQILARLATKALGLPPTWGQTRGRMMLGMTPPAGIGASMPRPSTTCSAVSRSSKSASISPSGCWRSKRKQPNSTRRAASYATRSLCPCSWSTLFGGFGVILFWPFMRALAERIRPRAAAAGTEQLQAEQERATRKSWRRPGTTVAELQERLDFAERLLAKQQDPARIAPPPR